MTTCFIVNFFCSGVLYAKNYTVQIGKTPVNVIKVSGNGKTFIHLHENEVTALVAAKQLLKQEGGSLITLQHSGERNIRFYLKGVRYEFDPNRIFTDRGIEKTLHSYGHYSISAHREVKKLAVKIISLLPTGKIIAVHNNKDYSLKEYLPKHPLASDVKALNYNHQTNYRDFYFVTQLQEYNRLKKLKFNVVLQTPHAQDDGSLSFYFAKKNYVNIEAAYGHLSTQLKMLHYA